jgi:cytochrome c oxidase assembly protein subunit 15
MAGGFVPPNLLAFDPVWTNPFDNPATVQWIHRCFGWLAFFTANGLWIALLRRKTPRGALRKWTTGLAHMTIMQFGLGIATLVLVVPVPLAALHQLGAAIIVILLTLLGHTLHRGIEPSNGFNARRRG